MEKPMTASFTLLLVVLVAGNCDFNNETGDNCVTVVVPKTETQSNTTVHNDHEEKGGNLVISHLQRPNTTKQLVTSKYGNNKKIKKTARRGKQPITITTTTTTTETDTTKMPSEKNGGKHKNIKKNKKNKKVERVLKKSHFDWFDLWTEHSTRNRGRGHRGRRNNVRKIKKVQRCNNLTEITCSGKCVPLVDICDGHNDCHDKRDEINCEEMEIRLVGGKREGEGRIEITISNMPGTVCSEGWNDKAARVVCRMFGYKDTSVAKAVTSSRFGKGSGVIWLSQVTCNGSENDLSECYSPVWGDHGCNHGQDAGVICADSIGYTEAPVAVQTTPKTRRFSEPTCGKRRIQPSRSRILGGRTSTYGMLPWQARILKIKGTTHYHQCGGAIIGKKWVLTAAHCMEGLLLGNLVVSVGDHDTTKIDLKEDIIKVDKVFLHPDFKPDSDLEHEYSLNVGGIMSWLGSKSRSSSDEIFSNDIAILKLRSSIEYSIYVQPVCLPTSTTPYQPGLKCEVSGWGLTSTSPMRVPDKLQYAMIPIMSTWDCEKSYEGLFKSRLPKEMFCAGYTTGAIDTCQGDSGGPLICDIHGVHTLMGVTSWGFECGESDSPGIYTKVGHVLGWIDDVLSERL